MRHIEPGKPRLGRFPQEDVMPYGNYWIAECLFREMSEDWSVLSKVSPVQQSTTVELIVNLKTAKTLGFTIRLVLVPGDPSLRPAVAGTRVAPAPRRSYSPAAANSGQPAVQAHAVACRRRTDQ
jgi:hypothetical protein